MNALARVTAFAATLVALSGGAAAVGAALGPVGAPSTSSHAQHSATGGHQTGEHDAVQSRSATPAGLQVSQDGYILELERDTYTRSGNASLRFRILDEQGAAITDFESLHGEQMHLILVRRDLDSFQHVHPVMDDDGTWSIDVDLADAGAYRVFTDFQPVTAERGLTLGHDLAVRGAYVPGELPAANAKSSVGGYEVRLAGQLVPGETSRLALTVTRDGQPITDLQPYLEAYGHLVALRDGDLAYLHVHPAGAPGDGKTAPGPTITFYAEVPSSGRYRLFLDFKHGDEVRTAAFTALAGGPTAPTANTPATPSTNEPTPHEKHTH